MYTVGLIKTGTPRVLINPQPCATVKELHAWLKTFLNDEKFMKDHTLSLEQVQEAVEKEEPGRVNFDGVGIALIFGKDSVIYKATDEFVYIE
ncbi:MAG: hypothetical protein M3512_02465 [Bacteroidota bacterium]|nr:hypothetical protein [Bacteroidota bacterium]